MLCLLAQPKGGNNQFKNKAQPEPPKNRTVWKFDNQGVNEETFIHTGRSGREESARWQLEDRAVPHWHVDTPGGTTGEQYRPRSPGF